MKKLFVSIIGTLTILLLPGCGKTQTNTITLLPDKTNLQSICKLATLECYFHNVAKSETKGILGMEATRKTFWIEYTGTVKIGIDFTKLESRMDGDQITIAIPNAQVLDIGIDDDSFNENSFYSEKNSLFNGKIKADEQTNAINEAQQKMLETAENDNALMLTAQERAKELIENYIVQLGELTGKTYSIVWKNAQ